MFKSKTPAERPDSFKNGYIEEAAWWNVEIESKVNDIWKLDPEIPSNYLPVPGEDELYMVVNEDGTIEKYRHRTKQQDGSWIWEDVDPNIPDHYEKVEGLDNIYKVTDKDGNISYYRYVRNPDDTFAFVPCDEKGNDLEETPTDETIPDNYIHLSGNAYAVTNENGVITGYKERTLNPDGTYIWNSIQKPTLNTDIASSNPTMYFNPEFSGGGTNTQTIVPVPVYIEGEQKDPTYILVTPNDIGSVPNDAVTEYHDDGTFTETETYTETETEGGYITTYQTTVIRVYDRNGNLLSTNKGERKEIDRVPIGIDTPDVPSDNEVKDTLGEEFARVSIGTSYDEGTAVELLTAMNASRASKGLPALTIDGGDLGMMARIRAAAAASYDYSDPNSPIYGSVNDMASKYGVSGDFSENIWKTSGKTGEQINTRFITLDSAQYSVLSSYSTKAGIAIVDRNGYQYVVCIVG